MERQDFSEIALSREEITTEAQRLFLLAQEGLEAIPGAWHPHADLRENETLEMKDSDTVHDAILKTVRNDPFYSFEKNGWHYHSSDNPRLREDAIQIHKTRVNTDEDLQTRHIQETICIVLKMDFDGIDVPFFWHSRIELESESDSFKETKASNSKNNAATIFLIETFLKEMSQT